MFLDSQSFGGAARKPATVDCRFAEAFSWTHGS